MNEKLFGTDGIRGIPGKHPLTREIIRSVAFSAMHRAKSGLAVIARDTRGSGPEIARWAAEGLASAGARVIDVGVAPTPAAAYLAPKLGAGCAVVVSASHNPPEFNGVKFFSAKGLKLDSAEEARVEREAETARPAAGWKPAKTENGEKFLEDYADFILSTVPSDLNLAGMRIVLDCANGAASAVAPEVLRRLGAEVSTIGCSPDGGNINSGCGALFTRPMLEETLRLKADCGLSLDGDADRVLFGDETGKLLDGDDLIFLAALELKSAGRLKWDRVVLTVMSNWGLISRLREEGITAALVPVGDKHVTDALEKENLSLGGESSGHIIFREFFPTGDGLLTAAQILSLMKRSGKPLSFFRKRWLRYPQSLTAVPVKEKIALEKIPGFAKMLEDFGRELKGKGRVFVRYSGTEPKLRVLVEGPRAARVETISKGIIAYYKKHAEGTLCR